MLSMISIYEIPIYRQLNWEHYVGFEGGKKNTMPSWTMNISLVNIIHYHLKGVG